MFNLFKKNIKNQSNNQNEKIISHQKEEISALCKKVIELNKKVKNNKENLDDFILILKQIQEANNQTASGKGSFFKNYKTKQLLVDNIVTLAIEKTKEKITELD